MPDDLSDERLHHILCAVQDHPDNRLRDIRGNIVLTEADVCALVREVQRRRGEHPGAVATRPCGCIVACAVYGYGDPNPGLAGREIAAWVAHDLTVDLRSDMRGVGCKPIRDGCCPDIWGRREEERRG